LSHSRIDCVLQALELPSEPNQPGSSLSLRVQPAQSSGTPATATSRPANENTDVVNNNVMSHSVTNPQALSRVQRSTSSTNPQKPSQSKHMRLWRCYSPFRYMLIWHSVNGVGRTNKVKLCREWLVLIVVTFGGIYW